MFNVKKKSIMTDEKNKRAKNGAGNETKISGSGIYF